MTASILGCGPKLSTVIKGGLPLSKSLTVTAKDGQTRANPVHGPSHLGRRRRGPIGRVVPLEVEQIYGYV